MFNTKKIKSIVREFEKFKKEIIGERKRNYFEAMLGYYFTGSKAKTIFEEIEALEDKFKKLEEYLGIEYKEEKKEFKGYKKVEETK